MRRFLISVGALLLFALPNVAFSQENNAIVSGVVTSNGNPVSFATAGIIALNKGTISNQNGEFSLNEVPSGIHELHISSVGFRKKVVEISVSENDSLFLQVELFPDMLQLENVVVTGTRSEIPLYEAPVIVSRVSSAMFQQTQSLNIADGLNFSPGLRVENNCQNCGFTQVRMNGLDGAYSQILVDNRPIFSALMGIYGLEMIPTSMVDRVEVVRGGGSALYGGNAIAGTVNIITKTPVVNELEASINYGSIDLNRSDFTLSVNGALIAPSNNRGLNFYAFHRNRDYWDSNGDGFSEMTQLENITLGVNSFWNVSERLQTKLNIYGMDEFRRGGSDFDLLPHQSQIAEQLKHKIAGFSGNIELFGANLSNQLTIFTAGQITQRDSYYGGGGRVIPAGEIPTESDILALNAYGNTNDISLSGGLQFQSEPTEHVGLVAGSEVSFNSVEDRMPGYQRSIDQNVLVWGNFVQTTLELGHRNTLVLGSRLDVLNIDGTFQNESEFFENAQNRTVFVPRISFMHEITESLRLRTTFSQGYRAPQAFDEDLHIETVGGAARFVRIDSDLQMERSNSVTASLNFTGEGRNRQSNIVLEGFFTQLQNPFILGNQQELASGVSVITKRNGDGASVYGVNLESNVAFGTRFMLSSGATVQAARFSRPEEIWTPESMNEMNSDSVITTRNMLRTPAIYGYINSTINVNKTVSLSTGLVYTGQMDVAHVINPETEFTVVKRTPDFLELNLKADFLLFDKNSRKMEISAGIQNVFNSFQRDFDIGSTRDAGYVYGPGRPRTVFMGVKYGM